MTTALVFGRATGVWEEVAEARKLCKFDYIIGIGSAGVDYPEPFDHWVSFHIDVFSHWIGLRSKKGYPPATTFWAAKYRGGIVRNKVTNLTINYVSCEGGSSGLIGVFVALDGLRADKVVLAGIPMDMERGQYDTGQPWKEAKQHRGAWERDLPKLLRRVKSMSGWTQEKLGVPTEAWLAERVAV